MGAGGDHRHEPEARITVLFEAVGLLISRVVGELTPLPLPGLSPRRLRPAPVPRPRWQVATEPMGLAELGDSATAAPAA